MYDYYFIDLHIHIGRTFTGRAVKITGSKNLTLQNILEASSSIKGLDIIEIIDCHSPEVLKKVEQKKMEELSSGGLLRYQQMTLILGSEIEIYDKNCQTIQRKIS